MKPDELILPALRGEPVPWPAEAGRGLEDAVLAAAADEGAEALLATAPAAASWPERVQSALRDALRAAAALEAVRRVELSRLLMDFEAGGVRPLLFKGAQLAYTHYARPWLRPRLDTDLLVAPGARRQADEVLRGRGYRSGTGFSGELVTHQFQYRRTGRLGLPDLVDLHWKVANPHVFAGAFTFEELERDAVTIEALGTAARGLSDPHALALACVHRVAHHSGSNRLIWLYDIHLLAGAMSEDGRGVIAGLAAERRLRAVCASGIGAARERLATEVPPGWLERLQAATSADEASAAAFLGSGRTKIDDLISDLRALDGWRPRLRLLREHLFPPVAYMRRAYGFSSAAFAPFAYAHRIAAGVRNWVRRS